VALADDDDGLAGRFDPNDDLLHVVVPDDLRELEPEIAAYHRELEVARRQARRRQLRRRFLPRWMRGGLPSPVFTAILLVVATTGLLLSVFAPVTQESARQLPISSLANPKQAPGTVGGLLPANVELISSDNRHIQARNVRPAVLILVPAGCKCASLIHQIVGQVNAVSPGPYTLIVSAGTDTTAATLASAKDGGNDLTLGVRDPKGVLAKAYSASDTAPTLVLVGGDGVTQAPRVFHDNDQLKGPLKTLHF
jgi:anti-sigma factor RsiW